MQLFQHRTIAAALALSAGLWLFEAMPCVAQEEPSAPITTAAEAAASESEATAEENAIYDLRGDDGVLRELRPSGVAFISPERLLICDSADQQLHIFDNEGRRFRRLVIPRKLSQPKYSGIALLSENKYLVVGDHYQNNNYTRFLRARSVLHQYELRSERFTDDSAKVNYDPEIALRNTGKWGENVLDNHMKIDGIACDPDNNFIYFALSQPLNKDESAIIYKAPLDQVLEKKSKIKLEVLDLGLVPGLDSSLNEPFVVTDISYVPHKGLLILTSSKTADERFNGSSQIWFAGDGSDTVRLVAEEIAPGNFAAGIAAIEDNGLYNIAVVFDNNPQLNDTPSRLMVINGIEL